MLSPEFWAQMEAGEAQWHVLNQGSGLAGTGTLVLMDVQLAHGATIVGVGDTDFSGVDELAAARSAAGVEAYRYSWDTRYIFLQGVCGFCMVGVPAHPMQRARFGSWAL